MIYEHDKFSIFWDSQPSPRGKRDNSNETNQTVLTDCSVLSTSRQQIYTEVCKMYAWTL